MKKPKEKTGESGGLIAVVGRGMMVTAASSILSAVLRIAILAVLARLVSPSAFGMLAAAMTVIGFAELLAQMGFASALLRIKEITPAHIATAGTLIIGSSTVLAVMITIFAPQLSVLLGDPQLTKPFLVLAWTFPLHAFAEMSMKLILRDLKFKAAAFVDIGAYTLASAAVTIPLAVAGWGIWALVWGQLAFNFLYALEAYRRAPFSLRFGWSRAEGRELIGFGGGIAIGHVFNYFARRGDNAVVSRMLGLEALGLYSRSYSVVDIANSLVGNVFLKVLVPGFARVQDKPEKLREGFLAGLEGNAFAGGIASAGLWLYAEPMIRVLLGEQWGGAVVLFKLFALGMFMRMACKLCNSLLQATGVVKELAVYQAVYAAAVVGGAIIAARFSLEAVVISTVLSLLVFYFLMLAAARRTIDAGWGDILRSHVPGIAASGLLLAVVTVFEHLLGSRMPSAAWLQLLVGIIPVTAALGVMLLAPRVFFGGRFWGLFRRVIKRPGGRHENA